jgi:tetratricopeptide (TPR) repeat protein
VSEPAGQNNALERGRTLIVAHQFDQAKRVLADTIAANPHNAAVWRMMALAHLGSEDYPDALDAANQALALAPQSADMHLLLARVLIASDRVREGVELARTALRIAPDMVDAHLVLARGLTVVRQELDQALWHAERARELEPDSARTHYAVGSALCAFRTRKAALRARESLETALRIDPQHSAAWNDLGLTELRRNRSAQAARDFVTTLQLDPQSRTAAHNLPLAIWMLVTRRFFWAQGILVLTVTLMIVAAICDANSLAAGIVAHVVAVAMVATASWWVTVRRLLRVFPATMRTAAWRMLRQDRLVRPTWLGVVWSGLVQTVAVAVPWGMGGLFNPTVNALLACVWLSAPGYYVGRFVSGARLRRTTKELEARRQQQWQAVVNPAQSARVSR